MYQQDAESASGRLLEAAQRYRDQDFALTPTKGKDAFVSGWQCSGTPAEDDVKYWGNGCAYGIGLVLGEASGGLVDIDRDCDLPNRIDKMFLPDTLMSGRAKRPYTVGDGDNSRSQGAGLATPLSLTLKEPFAAPLKVPLLIHSISAALSVAWGPAQGSPGFPP